MRFTAVARIRTIGRILGLFGLLCPVSSAMGQSSGAPSAPVSPPPAKPAADDGWPDLSAFLDRKFGFLPIVAIITEPAVGFGLAGGLAFIDAPLSQGRPDVTLVGGMATENGSKGGFAADMRHWLGGRLETRAALFDVSVNLDFYGIGENPVLADDPLRYNIKPSGGLIDTRYRLGNTRLWAGLGYAYARTTVSFEAPSGTPGLPDFSSTSTVGGVVPSLLYDARDNYFTPNRGSYVETTAGLFSPALGADDTYQRMQVIAIQYVPLRERFVLGVRGQAAASSDGTPFYMRPYIYQRGVPAMRYLGEAMAQVEAELRWQFWKRFSVVGFGGTGATWVSLEGVESTQSVTAGGAGMRYEVARKYGIHVGADLAYGPDGGAFYLQFGSAWIR